MGAALLACLLATAGGAADLRAGLVDRGWLTAAGGAESDLTLDPGPTPSLVEGGPFVTVIGGLGGRFGLPRRPRLDLGGQVWYERFTAADERAVFSATLLGDLQLPLDRSWAVRVGAGARHYDDSARPTSRLEAGWGEAGLVWARGAWRLELQGGLEGHRYPRLTLPDDAGTPGTYTERQATAGFHAEVRLGSRARLRGAGHARRTDARDPYYASEGPTAEVGAEVVLARGLRLLADGFCEQRTFTARAAGTERDRYRQAGLGLEADLGPRWQLRVTGAVSRYTWPDGTDVDTHRWQAGLTCRIGADGRAGLPRPGGFGRRDDPAAPRAGAPLEFRVHAPQARAVSLVGDFNGWDPGAEPMHRAGGGWWRTSRRLAAGTHAYAYVVDGTWLTPPEAAAREPDGFGGHNGLLVVLP